ncbi:hypothetical protein [Nocardioides sp. zg-DK7169]|uniref:hypothetical protein n=1 Tax=Nocardioides sp. zg-DK7169 TaxID=2736600 RepID=UPI0015573876|nr:hypothetical protein [Nocardioides sp. zg-DK7169]NPC97302.1 hypothetical protein [Nocardioides sp. zg-DK7169]
MAAPLTVLEDTTPLLGPTIDTGARIGWLLRMARLVAGEGRFVRLEDMAAVVETNVTALHRIETGRTRRGVVIDAYERVLGLPPGALRAPVDVLCRHFGNGPVDREPGQVVDTVAGLSALTDLVLDGDPDGSEWLTWARAMSQPFALGLPHRIAEPLVRRLAGELGRSQGRAYPIRHEALALLRRSGYGAVVLEAVKDIVADPHAQMVGGPLSVLAEQPSSDAARWLATQLGDPRMQINVSAAVALEKMGQASPDPEFWVPLVDLVAAAYETTEPGSQHWECVSHVLRLIPPDQRRRRLAGWAPPHRLSSVGVETLRAADDQDSAIWLECVERARAVCREVEVPYQPMLARLLFDSAFGPYDVRASTAFALLSGLPAITVPLHEQIAQIATEHTDPYVVLRARSRLSFSRLGAVPRTARTWVDHPDPVFRHIGLLLLGTAGEKPPERQVEEALRGDINAANAALQGLGMVGDPRLRTIVADDTLPQVVRDNAAWWLRNGTRVVDDSDHVAR